MSLSASLRADEGYFGVASIDITPLTPIRLSGYAARSTESTGVAQNLYAQAAAFGTGADTAIMIAVDCTGVPDNVADIVSASLSDQLGIAGERFVITSTHTHNGPCVDGYLDNLFGAPLPPQQQERIEQYTAELISKLQQVAHDAFDNRTPGHQITWGQGSVGFGVNRRGRSIAPVDHDLPVIRVAAPNGDTRAIITSYAAHAVTLGSANNDVSGDWPGYAREAIEAIYPGAVALVMTGAGGDINPSPRGNVTNASNHGQSIANEVQRLVSDNLLHPVGSKIGAAHGEVELQFATQLEPGDPASARLAPAPSHHDYGITSWTFGDDIAMVFLEGEVTVDYSLRLKSHHDDGRMWVNAYSNDVQGYIPSERILYEGGYEADNSGYYYDLPGRFAHGIEDKIVNEVMRQLDPFFNPADRLRLRIDRSTGAMVIVNEWDEVIEFDAYTIVSQEGRFSGPWNSLADQGIAGWDEADNASPYRLTEFNPTNSSILASGESLTIGAPFAPHPPSRFGEAVEVTEVEFEYNPVGLGEVQGRVEFVDTRHNNLVLTIDPETGRAAVQNDSAYFDAEIDAYTISSASGLLQTADEGWESLADQGMAGWDEADNSDPFRITEFNLSGATLLEGGGEVLRLGKILDIAGEAIWLDDLQFEFKLEDGEIVSGIIAIGALTSLSGDYDGNGAIDFDDYNHWKSAFGMIVPAGSGADGNGDGVVDAADYTVWRDNLLATTTTAVSPVPEPASLLVVVVGVATLTLRRPPSRCR